jgi:hypothetical protein
VSQLPVRLRAGKLFRAAKRGAFDAAHGDWLSDLALFQIGLDEFLVVACGCTGYYLPT